MQGPLDDRLFDNPFVAEMDVGELGIRILEIELDLTRGFGTTAADFGNPIFETIGKLDAYPMLFAGQDYGSALLMLRRFRAPPDAPCVHRRRSPTLSA